MITRSYEKMSIRAFARTAFATNELISGIMYNPTRIKNIINSFMVKNRIKNADLLISIEGSAIFQTILQLPKASPQPSDFRIARLHTLIWDYLYLYPQDDGLFSFYIAGMPQSLLMQYTLLFISLRLQPQIITTELTAHIYLYRSLYGAAFRTSQLAHDMQSNDNQLTRFFAPETIKRLAHIPHHLATEHSYVITALGLAALGKKLYGN